MVPGRMRTDQHSKNALIVNVSSGTVPASTSLRRFGACPPPRCASGPTPSQGRDGSSRHSRDGLPPPTVAVPVDRVLAAAPSLAHAASAFSSSWATTSASALAGIRQGTAALRPLRGPVPGRPSRAVWAQVTGRPRRTAHRAHRVRRSSADAGSRRHLAVNMVVRPALRHRSGDARDRRQRDRHHPRLIRAGRSLRCGLESAGRSVGRALRGNPVGPKSPPGLEDTPARICLSPGTRRSRGSALRTGLRACRGGCPVRSRVERAAIRTGAPSGGTLQGSTSHVRVEKWVRTTFADLARRHLAPSVEQECLSLDPAGGARANGRGSSRRPRHGRWKPWPGRSRWRRR
ncbi:hypothetical protein BS35_002024 [Actinomadura glauciflava]|nr:hypothetical protein [Actinomadura glauciflava]